MRAAYLHSFYHQIHRAIRTRCTIALFAILCLGTSYGQDVKQTPNLLENILGRNELLDKWRAPEYLRKNFPYEFSGYDEENRPIIILSFGKWDWSRALDSGGVSVEQLNKLADQVIYRVRKWAVESGAEGPGNVVLILDFDGFSVSHIASKGASEHALSVFKKLGIIHEKIAYGFFVNTNFVAESLIIMSRPFMGSMLEKFELYGTRQQQWLPRLLKKLPADQLPGVYGGTSKNFKPIFAYGSS